MSAVFDKNSKTILVVDIENASVATALVQVSALALPKLFSENRVPIIARPPFLSTYIAPRLIDALNDSLAQTNMVSRLLRQNKEDAQNSEISKIALYLSAPWVHSQAGNTSLQWSFEPEFVKMAQSVLESFAEAADIKVHPSSIATFQTIKKMSFDTALVITITGEVLELMSIENSRIKSYATIPFGFNTLYRAVTEDGGVSTHEAQSLLYLKQKNQFLVTPADYLFDATASIVASELRSVLEPLMYAAPAQSIVVVGPELESDWFVRSVLPKDSITELFPEGGVVRAIKQKHIAPHVASVEERSDIPLMMRALHVDMHNQNDI